LGSGAITSAGIGVAPIFPVPPKKLRKPTENSGPGETLIPTWFVGADYYSEKDRLARISKFKRDN
jgi:hypothetical protein